MNSGHETPQHDALPIEIAFQVDELCNQFEQACRNGESPALRDYVRRVDARGVDRLLEELVAIRSELQGQTSPRDDPRDALREFETSLCDSGIVAVQDLMDARAEGQITTALDLARELVSQRKITRYQALLALEGAAAELDLGRYLILDRIGRGGMGEVYLARHRLLGRHVAIKMLSSQPQYLGQERFTEEMRLGAELMHPNIVAIYDADQIRGKQFLAMEYVEGKDLRAIVKRGGPLSVRDALRCVKQTAVGLEFAHSRSIVHRDIKPANLLYSINGDIKILDFGLGKRHHLSASDDLTATGVALGTFDYMAPEQAVNAKSVDHRADIYSLGCTMHFLLTGEPPFDGDNSAEKIVAHREQQIPDLKQQRTEISSDINGLFQQLLAKSPDQRFATAAAVAEAVSALLETSETPSVRIQGAAVAPFTSPSGMKFVKITAGEFMMGSDSEEREDWHDQGYLTHAVKLTKDYWLGVFPVTQSQFREILGTNPSVNQGDELPVEKVSWYDAIAFLNRLSEQESLDPYYEIDGDEVTIAGGLGYRLATEAEWEFACRAGSQSPWYFGENGEHLSLCGWTSTNSDGYTHPVGQKMANRNGLHDMYGNVWEWCWDRYDQLYYGYSPDVDPTGPQYGIQRVIRGGSFAHTRNCCSAARSGIAADERNQNVGFRVARDAPAEHSV
jgi:serine/threonine protein kinase